MQKLFKGPPLVLSAVLSSILLIPLIAMELINRREFHEDFPFSIFTFTWIIQTLFILIFTSLIRDIWSGKSLMKNRTRFILQVVSLGLLANIWGGWIVDQWPCLMGVPNCD